MIPFSSSSGMGRSLEPFIGVPARRIRESLQAAGVSDVQRDYPRRIRAELLEIKEQLDHCDPHGTDPLTNTLRMWHRQFESMLRHDDIVDVVSSFSDALESIFKNPLDPDAPFNPELYTLSPSPIVIFMIGKMRDLNSLLFSQKLANDVPFNALPSSFYRENTMQKIERQRRIFLLRSNRELQQTTSRHLRETVVGVFEGQNARLAAIQQNVQTVFDEAKRSIDETRANIARDSVVIQKEIDRLQIEVNELIRSNIELRSHIESNGRGLSQLERANAELKIAINQVHEEIKKQQKQWFGQALQVIGCIGLSFCATWALGYALNGATIGVTPNSVRVGVSITF